MDKAGPLRSGPTPHDPAARMSLAYSISAYRLPGQFAWLMAAIWHPDDLFIVHVDAKTPPDVLAEFIAAAGDRPNIRFLERETIVWMGAGLVRAELRAIRVALELAPGFSHLVSLSGQDYPLQPRDAIRAALAREPERNFVTCMPLAEQPWHVRRRPFLLAFERSGRLVRTPLPRPVPRGLRIAWKGSWWRILNRSFCAWLTTSPKTTAYLAFLANVQAPDELFFQNLIMASPFAATLADRNRHLVLWPGDSGSPLTLCAAQLPALEESRLFFARKFDHTRDVEVLHRLARRIGAVAPTPELAAAA